MRLSRWPAPPSSLTRELTVTSESDVVWLTHTYPTPNSSQCMAERIGTGILLCVFATYYAIKAYCLRFYLKHMEHYTVTLLLSLSCTHCDKKNKYILLY